MVNDAVAMAELQISAGRTGLASATSLAPRSHSSAPEPARIPMYAPDRMRSAAEVLVDGKRFAIVTARESYDDLTRLEVAEPQWRL